ncbi:DUF58 domain-containing protein [Porticoccus sp. W117]|uniref:DUF58 domain-containing protein n=1 Tax=Porticoccus sp. W117 TaxID=3054777 RepID=UPI00259A76F9|nr:DUF58 domain-containing protein [Porticoccus sp. W117]MDM3870350.1 DUF58 domain-containing protein [Porticoccus sp. W117]
MNNSVSYQELFDPDFLNSLAHLSMTVRRVAGGGRYGERLSRDMGTGVEFKDFRPYAKGDDLRSIDWNIYRRLGKVFIRLFDEQQDMPLYFMPDISESMFLSEKAHGGASSTRALAAFRAVLALTAVTTNHHDSAGLFPFGKQLQVVLKSKTGKASLMAFARHMSQLQPQSQSNLVQSLKKMASMNMRPGVLVIVSDFFLADGLQELATALRSVRHKLLFIQVTRKLDSDPRLQADLNGEVRLTDCESGEFADIAITPQIVARYQQAYKQFNEELSGIAASNRAGLLQLDADENVVEQLSVLFQSGSLSV